MPVPLYFSLMTHKNIMMLTKYDSKPKFPEGLKLWPSLNVLRYIIPLPTSERRSQDSSEQLKRKRKKNIIFCIVINDMTLGHYLSGY